MESTCWRVPGPDGKTRHGNTPQAQYPEPKDGRKAAPPPEEDEDD